MNTSKVGVDLTRGGYSRLQMTLRKKVPSGELTKAAMVWLLHEGDFRKGEEISRDEGQKVPDEPR